MGTPWKAPVMLHAVPGLNSVFGELLVNAGDGPSLIINRDLTNILLVGRDKALGRQGQVAGSDLSLIDPLGSMAVDGTETLFGQGVQATGTISIDVKQGATNWAPSPAQVAAQINALGLAKDTTVNNVHTDLSLGTNQFLSGASASAMAGAGSTTAKDISTTGAPLLNLKTVLAQQTSFTSIAASGSLTISNLVISQISYELSIVAETSAAAQTPVIVQLKWIDSTTTFVVAQQEFSFFAGSVASPHTIEGHGPSAADRLTIVIINGSTANSVSVEYVVTQASRPYLKHLWKTVAAFGTLPSIPGLTMAPGDPNAGILIDTEDILAASALVKYVLPLYTGDVTWNARDNGGVTALSQFFIHAVVWTGTIANDVIAARQSGQSGFAGFTASSTEGDITLPRTQCVHESHNQNTSSTRTLDAVMIAKQE